MAASRRASPPTNTPTAARRGVAIKRADGEPLTRVDVQYDFLRGVFEDSRQVFSDPYPALVQKTQKKEKEKEKEKDAGPLPRSKLCFRDLYIKAIFNSAKATKALKDKMGESDVFAQDFAMLALLVNVGRVNTTMSFFPEMKTAIRTYHPIPSLQRTNGNMQDAPRIKHILKTSILEDESKNPPSTPSDILARHEGGHSPSTSVANLIFVLAHHSGPVGQAHFQGRLDFIDLFLRTELSSASRAQAFLWLCYKYLESPIPKDGFESTSNPFADPANKSSPPPLVPLESAQEENQESPEDITLTEKLVAQRNRIVQSHSVKGTTTTTTTTGGKAPAKVSVNGSVMGDRDEEDLNSISMAVEDTTRKRPAAAPATASKARAKRKEKKALSVSVVDKPKEREHIAVLPDLDDDDDTLLDAFLTQRSRPILHARDRFEHSLNLYSSCAASLSTHRNLIASDRYGPSHRHRYSPYGQPSSPVKDRYRSHSRHAQPRSMLQQAWQIISSTDPLVDSDDEAGGDEYAREDYVQRLKVINRFSRHHWTHEQPPSAMETDPI